MELARIACHQQVNVLLLLLLVAICCGHRHSNDDIDNLLKNRPYALKSSPIHCSTGTISSRDHARHAEHVDPEEEEDNMSLLHVSAVSRSRPSETPLDEVDMQETATNPDDYNFEDAIETNAAKEFMSRDAFRRDDDTFEDLIQTNDDEVEMLRDVSNRDDAHFENFIETAEDEAAMPTSAAAPFNSEFTDGDDVAINDAAEVEVPAAISKAGHLDVLTTPSNAEYASGITLEHEAITEMQKNGDLLKALLANTSAPAGTARADVTAREDEEMSLFATSLKHVMRKAVLAFPELPLYCVGIFAIVMVMLVCSGFFILGRTSYASALKESQFSPPTPVRPFRDSAFPLNAPEIQATGKMQVRSTKLPTRGSNSSSSHAGRLSFTRSLEQPAHEIATSKAVSWGNAEVMMVHGDEVTIRRGPVHEPLMKLPGAQTCYVVPSLFQALPYARAFSCKKLVKDAVGQSIASLEFSRNQQHRAATNVGPSMELEVISLRSPREEELAFAELSAAELPGQGCWQRCLVFGESHVLLGQLQMQVPNLNAQHAGDTEFMFISGPQTRESLHYQYRIVESQSGNRCFRTDADEVVASLSLTTSSGEVTMQEYRMIPYRDGLDAGLVFLLTWCCDRMKDLHFNSKPMLRNSM